MMDRTYADCMLMIVEAAIEYVAENTSRFAYGELAYWLNRHGDLFRALYGSLI
jgi:hypothetical protein